MNTTSTTGATQTTLPPNPLFLDGKNFAGPIESLRRVAFILEIFQDIATQEDNGELRLSTGGGAGLAFLIGFLKDTVNQAAERLIEKS